MKIGNGPLNISMIGFSDNGEFSIPKLKELAKATLDFHPLGDIFNIDYIESKSNEDYFKFLWLDKGLKLKKDLDIIAIIKNTELPRYDRGNIVYSHMDPAILAHELGHALRLKHFSINCCIYHYDKVDCPYLEYIMCSVRNDIKGFSPENIEKLEKWYLK